MVTDRTSELKSNFIRGKKGLFPFLYRRVYDWQKPQYFSKKKHKHGLTLAGQAAFESHGIFLDSIARTLLGSPTFRAMIDDETDLEKVFMHIDNRLPFGGYQRSIITIGQEHIETHGFNPEPFIFIAAHEFRHAWQEVRNVLNRQLGLSASDIVTLYKVIEADAVAFQTTVCYELAQAGIPAPLNHLLWSQYGQFAQAFLDKVEKNPLSAKTGTAQRAAYMAYLGNQTASRSYAMSACKNFSDYRIADNLRFRFRPVSSLVGVNLALSSMPYYDEAGNLMQRDAYDITPKTPREIALTADLPDAGVILKVKHLERQHPPRPIR